jgi:hypothetical protein
VQVQNTNRISIGNNPRARLIDNAALPFIVGTVLIVVLGGLTSFNPLLGLTSILVLFLWILVAPRPILIAYGLTLLFPLTGGLARGAVLPFLRIPQALLLLGFILFLLAKPSALGKSRLTAIDLAFVFLMFSEAVFPVLAIYFRGEYLNLNDTNNVYGGSPLQTLLGPIQYYLLYRIIVSSIDSEKQIKTLINISFITSNIVSIFGIMERFIPSVRNFIQTYYPTIVQGSTTPLDELRITSTLGHFSGLAAYLVFTLILALACYTAKGTIKISLPLLAATTVFDSIALILTGTFAGWIGLVVGIVAVLLLIRRVPKLFILVIIGIVLAALIFQSFLSSRLNNELGAGNAQGLVPQSLAFRIQLWQNLFLPAIGQHLLFGSGPDPVALKYWPSEESQYLLFLLRGGIFYLLGYLLLIAMGINVCRQKIKSRSKEASYPVAIALLVIFLVLNVMNMSGEYFTYVGGTQTLWTLFAIVVASRQLKDVWLKDSNL